MNRTLLTLAVLVAAGTTGTALAQTAIVGGPNVVLPPGGANAATHMKTSAGTVAADTTIGAVIASTPPGAVSSAGPRGAGAAAAAQRRIEMDGYKNVQGMTRGANGQWQATAMRGSTQVQVSVDRRGNVSAQ